MSEATDPKPPTSAGVAARILTHVLEEVQAARAQGTPEDELVIALGLVAEGLQRHYDAAVGIALKRNLDRVMPGLKW